MKDFFLLLHVIFSFFSLVDRLNWYFNRVNANTNAMKNKKNVLLIVVGSVTGLINGFFGGGGGMLVVPMLALLLGLEQKKAHATAIAVIFPITLVSAGIYLFGGSFNMPFYSALFTLIGVTLGGVVGALALKKISNTTLVKAFAVVMLVAGVKMLFF